MTRLTIALLIFLASACTDEAASRTALENYGFTEIRFTGFDMWACGKGDDFATGFVATNPTGKRVTGTVCCGLLKSCTVRF